MAITADDVSLEDIIPISLDFAVVEGELPLARCASMNSSIARKDIVFLKIT